MDHSGEIRTLAARPDGKAIATVSPDGIIRLWDALTSRLIARQQAPESRNGRFELAFHPAGTMLVSGLPRRRRCGGSMERRSSSRLSP